MKCICCNCGKVFDEKKIKIISEYRGEFWGMPSYENVEVSPCCEDDFDEVKEDLSW